MNIWYAPNCSAIPIFFRFWRLNLVSISANKRRQFSPRSLKINKFLKVFNSFRIPLYIEDERLHIVKSGEQLYRKR